MVIVTENDREKDNVDEIEETVKSNQASNSKKSEFSLLDDDANAPYYLYHGENGTSGSITPILTGSNYISWEGKFWLQLSFRNKTGFLDGSIKEPRKGTAEHRSWFRCNQLILSWMVHSVAVDSGRPEAI